LLSLLARQLGWRRRIRTFGRRQRTVLGIVVVAIGIPPLDEVKLLTRAAKEFQHMPVVSELKIDAGLPDARKRLLGRIVGR
jgi:hypothetical protein